MTTVGVVRNWDAGEGWGVIESPATPGGCWAHFSSLVGSGHLYPGQEVALDYELAQQDGYDYRATQVQPSSEAPDWSIVATGPSTAYRSELTINFDRSDESDRP